MIYNKLNYGIFKHQLIESIFTDCINDNIRIEDMLYDASQHGEHNITWSYTIELKKFHIFASHYWTIKEYTFNFKDHKEAVRFKLKWTI